MKRNKQMAIKEFENEYRFLSNFFEEKVVYENIEWASSEAAYQAAKFIDPEIKKQFINLSPDKSKKLARKLSGQIRKDFHDIKYGIMYDIVLAKFSQHEYLKEKLINTGNEELIEGNWWGDIYWGVCNGSGQNNLGKILMDIRSKFINN